MWEFMVEDVFPGEQESIPCSTLQEIIAAIAKLYANGCIDHCILGRTVGAEVWDCCCRMFRSK